MEPGYTKKIRVAGDDGLSVWLATGSGFDNDTRHTQRATSSRVYPREPVCRQPRLRLPMLGYHGSLRLYKFGFKPKAPDGPHEVQWFV